MSIERTQHARMTRLKGADELIAELASAQRGMVARRQLLAADVSRTEVAWRLNHGRLHAVHPGVYSVGHAWAGVEGRRSAALLATGDESELSHVSAAEVWGIWVRRPGRLIDVTTARRVRVRLVGVRVHGLRPVAEVDLAHRDGWRVTTVARTIVDLAEGVDAYALARVMHEAAFHELLSVASVRSCLERLRARPHAGASVVERALELHESGSAGTRSQLERRFLATLRAAGLPEPLVNLHVRTAGGPVEVDMHWRGHRLCVEIDGPGHRRPRSRREDARRDALLRAAGCRVLRIPGHILDEHPEQVVRTVAAALHSCALSEPGGSPL